MIGVTWLVEHGATLLLGSTALLVAGALAVGCSRAPIHRQRLAELSVVAALLWLVLAVVPMPRCTTDEVARVWMRWLASSTEARSRSGVAPLAPSNR